MPENCPTSPDWVALGFPPKPEPPAQPTSFNNPFSLPPDPEYLEEVKLWVGNLSPQQRKIYYDYQDQTRTWRRQMREELETIETQEYEKYGLEVGVDSYEKLLFVRNKTSLLGRMERLQVDIEGQEANEQFENFFKSK